MRLSFLFFYLLIFIVSLINITTFVTWQEPEEIIETPIPHERPFLSLLHETPQDVRNSVLSIDNFDYENTPISKRPKFPFTGFTNIPLVSIITTYYNSGPIIRETAESISRQTFKNFEWIIVNDGSKPDSILLELAKDYKFKLIDKKKNVGLPAARNKGINVASGQYVVFLDSDDLIEPTFLEKCVWFLEMHPTSTYVNTFSVAFGHKRYLHLLTHQDHSQMLLEKNIFPVTSMMRSYILKKVGSFDGSLRSGMEDWDLLMKLQDRGHCGFTIPEIHFWYRMHEDIRWRQNDEKTGEETRRKFGEMLKERYSGLFERGILKCEEEMQVESYHIENPLHTDSHAILVVLDNFGDSDENIYHVDVMRQLSHLGYHVTVVATTPQPINIRNIESQLYEFTNDVFNLHKFIPEYNHEMFLDYLVKSRGIKTILLSRSDAGYRFVSANSERLFGSNVKVVELIHDHQNLMTITNFTITTSQSLIPTLRAGMPDPYQSLSTVYFGVDTDFWRPIEAKTYTATMLWIIQEGDIMDPAFSRIWTETGGNFNVHILLDISSSVKDIKELPIIQVLSRMQTSTLSDRFRITRLTERLDRNYKIRQIQDHMNRADFFFVSGKSALSPWIFRALAMECVIIAPRSIGTSEIITPDVGFLFDRERDDTLSATVAELKTLFANSEKAVTRIEMMRKQAREVVLNLNIQDMMSSFVEIINQQ